MRQRITFSRQSMMEKEASDVAAHIAMLEARPGKSVYRVCSYRCERDERGELSRANHFRLDELTINREGRLSGHQRTRLFFSLSMTGVGGLIALAGIPFGVSLFVQWNLAHTLWVVWLVGLFIGLLLLSIVFACSWQVLLLLRDCLEERVIPREGKVERLARRANDASSATYQYIADDFSYNVSKAAYRALASGQRYRLYHTPYAHRLISLEPLESDTSQ